MSTVVLDTITGKSTATTITIGSTPVVSASANSMTIRGEGSNQTSIQQGLAKSWIHVANDQSINDSLNISSLDDDGTGDYGININNDFSNATWAFTFGHDDQAHATIILSTEISQGTQAAGAVDIEQIYVNSSINRTHYDGVFAMTCHGDLS
jgi:hypothetical protein